MTQFPHDLLHLVEALLFGVELIVRDTRDFRMRVGAAERFGIDVLSDGGLYQVGAGQEDGAGAPDHDRFVAHDRQVGPAGDTRAQNNGDLGDAHGAHAGIVAKDATEVFFIGEDLVLHGQEDAGAVHEIDHGKMVLHGYFLQAQVFLTSYGEPGAGLYGLIVGDDDALPFADIADPGDGTTGGAAALGFVQLITRKGAEFDKGAVFIDEVTDALTRCTLFLFVLFFYRSLAAAECDLIQAILKQAEGLAHGVFIFVEIQAFHIAQY